jgi:RNA polymerase sigma-70 factor (ECF subfamily)
LTLQAGIEAQLGHVLATAYQVALSLTGQARAAEALVEEASLLALHAPDRIRPQADLKLGVLSVLIDIFSSGEATTERTGRATLDPTTDAIVAAIRELPLEFRTVTALYFADDLRYEEMGAVLNLPVATVRERLHQGRRSVVRVLGPVIAEQVRVH